MHNDRLPAAASQEAEREFQTGFETFPFALPPDLPGPYERMTFLGVAYLHFKTSDGGDLYLTRFGVPFWRNLAPENWFAREWFVANRERLEGTSVVYRVPTRRVHGTALDLVVKFSRVGEVVPLDTFTVNKFINAEFNSPFEEFSLLMELRAGRMGPPRIRIRTQHPLAIYVPNNKLKLWQTGRSEDKIRAKISRHPGVEIDILRQYVLLFGWIKGCDAVATASFLKLKGEERERFVSHTNSLVIHELAQKGYRVADMKPQHVILRMRRDGSLLRDRNGQFVYALVDYELLLRTPEHEQAVLSASRRFYLRTMARRFDANIVKALPPHLKAMNILGVDYIFGHAESTQGTLWVVGRDPDLFSFFLPERWRRTTKRKLSSRNQVYYTRTKDNINLVWKVSRMGDTPWLTNPEARKEEAQVHGFNSPFEEFAIAMALTRAGVRTVYPRAIYMTGSQRDPGRALTDSRRHEALNHLLTSDGELVLRQDRDYITVWGFWNGPDTMLAEDDTHHYYAMNAGQAMHQGLLDKPTVDELMALKARRLLIHGVEDLNPKPDHLLVSFDADGQMIRGQNGKPEVLLCNFEFLRYVKEGASLITDPPAKPAPSPG